MAIGVIRNDTPTTLYSTDLTQGDSLAVDQYGRLKTSVTVSPTTAGTSTLSNVSVTTASITVLAANAGRLGATLFNDSAVPTFIKFGSSASATSFTVNLLGQGFFEVPFTYTGIITGITASSTATIRVTELTA